MNINSNPRKRRRVQFSGADELYPQLQKLNRLVRWHYFMEFNTKKIHEVITEVLGDDVSPDDYEYSIARQRALEWTKSWKSKTLQLMLVCYSISFFLGFVLTGVAICSRGKGPGQAGCWPQYCQRRQYPGPCQSLQAKVYT
jgi:hypothetical protein